MASDGTLALASRDTTVYEAPYDAANELPDDTVDALDAWGTPWVDLGGTVGGILAALEVSYADLYFDQQPDPVLTPATTRSIRLETGLGEITPENIQVATGQGEISTVAPGVSTRGHHDLEIGAHIDETTNAFGLESLQQNGEAWRMFIPRGLTVSSPSMQVGQPTTLAVIDLKVRALADVGPTVVYRNVIPATG